MSTTLRIPSNSPFLRYAPYHDGSPTTGWNASGGGYGQYAPSGSTTISSWTHGGSSSVEIQFNGSSIQLLGSMASPLTYTLTLDSQVSSTYSSVPSSNTLASYTGLSTSTPHTLFLNTTTSGGTDGWLQLDTVLLTVPLNGKANATFDDADTSTFEYIGTWGTGAAAAAGTYLGTTTYTQQTNAAANIYFSGTSLSLYGSIQPDHGLYAVTVDGVAYGTYNGSSTAGFVQQLLWYGGGWSDGDHVAIVTDVDGSKLDLDYVVVTTTPSTTAARRIAGISIGASVAAVIAGGIVFWIWRQERLGRRRLNEYVRLHVEKSRGEIDGY